jgi:5-formyltetrahydrofolate cyclo-ligase
LIFRRVSDRRQLRKGAYGLREPADLCPLCALEELDIVVTPGLGFDRRGYRLGYGEGYYDRCLAGLRPQCLTIGLAFACQVVPLLPSGPLDQPVDLILTEEETIWTEAGKKKRQSLWLPEEDRGSAGQ